jgi:hypothetical protein
MNPMTDQHKAADFYKALERRVDKEVGAGKSRGLTDEKDVIGMDDEEAEEQKPKIIKIKMRALW